MTSSSSGYSEYLETNLPPCWLNLKKVQASELQVCRSCFIQGNNFSGSAHLVQVALIQILVIWAGPNWGRSGVGGGERRGSARKSKNGILSQCQSERRAEDLRRRCEAGKAHLRVVRCVPTELETVCLAKYRQTCELNKKTFRNVQASNKKQTSVSRVSSSY
jgi:hypothetical protein